MRAHGTPCDLILAATPAARIRTVQMRVQCTTDCAHRAPGLAQARVAKAPGRAFGDGECERTQADDVVEERLR